MSATVLRKSYPAVKEAVASVRHDVATVASFLGADEEAVENVRLAVSEAATNVVRSIFEHSAGRMHVTVVPRDARSIAVTVADAGHGLLPSRPDSASGLSIIVMRHCAEALEVRRSAAGGIEVEMRFSTCGSAQQAHRRPAGPGQHERTAAEPSGEIATHAAAD